MGDTTTQRLFPDDEGIGRAAEILGRGGIVAFPTETVYGLGANARDGVAVAKIYQAKGRPAFNPLIVHLPTLAAVARLCIMNDTARQLAQAFWPGPLTLVLPLKADAEISRLVTAGLDTLAVRIPDGAVAQALLRAVNAPIAAPSANPSGRISATTADHVLAGLEGRIDAVLDAGPCEVGIESTIVDCTVTPPALLRAGGLPLEALSACLGGDLIGASEDPIAPKSPGQLTSHYAPRGTLRLNVKLAEADEVMLGFAEIEGDLTLSASGDLTEAAASLFERLHQLDARGAKRIAVAPIPRHGLGLAINDRLERAAADR